MNSIGFPASKLLKKKEVAKLLSCSSRTIERLAASGRLKSIKTVGAVRFKSADVEKIIQEGTL